MKIALAHDSFTQMGGAERVVDALHELFPEAPVFTLVYDPKFSQKYKGWDIQTSSLQVLYLALGKIQYLLPLVPWGVDSLNLELYDVVISSSSSWIKNIRVPKNCIHIDYCHTPTRFLWSDSNYIKQEVPWWQRPFVKIILNRMKDWDLKGAQRVTKFIANSAEVQSRIKKYYNRDSEVIYPFVDTDFWKPMQFLRHSEGVQPTEESLTQKTKGSLGSTRDDTFRSYFLLAGRLQPYKKLDLIVEIFNELSIPLHVVGEGRDLPRLKSIAKSNIKFFGRVSDEELREQYQNAKALIFPQIEDLGLMPLEAAACGTPTLAYGHGGALETIIAGQTGEFFDNYDKEKIKQIILSWDQSKYSVEALRSQAEKFSKEKFKENILKIVNENRG